MPYHTMLSIYTNNQLNPSLKGPIVIYSGSCTLGKGQILNNLRMVGYRTHILKIWAQIYHFVQILAFQSLHLLECWQLPAMRWIPLEALPSAKEFLCLRSHPLPGASSHPVPGHCQSVWLTPFVSVSNSSEGLLQLHSCTHGSAASQALTPKSLELSLVLRLLSYRPDPMPPPAPWVPDLKVTGVTQMHSSLFVLWIQWFNTRFVARKIA